MTANGFSELLACTVIYCLSVIFDILYRELCRNKCYVQFFLLLSIKSKKMYYF